MAESSRFLEITETPSTVVARFTDPKVLNDSNMETMAQELFRLGEGLAGRVLRLDFGKVEYLQSSVLGKLVTLKKRLGEGGRLVLCNVSPVVFKVFTITKLEKFFVMEPPVEAPPTGEPPA